MKSKITCAVLTAVIMLIACFAGGCQKEKDGEDPAVFSQKAQTFINSVEKIETPITLNSEAGIDAAYIVYGFLSDAEKAYEKVSESKTVLDGYKAEYDVLKAEDDARIESENEAVRRTSFINAVEKLPAISLLTSGDRALVDSAFEIYNSLNGSSKEVTEVVIAYSVLAKANEKVGELEYAEHMQEVRTLAKAFIDGVNSIGEVSLDSEKDIENLLYDYEDFTDEIRNYDGVEQAKNKLDEIYSQYQVIKDADDVRNFKSLVAGLTPAETAVTLDSKTVIETAESAYRYMSDAAKNADGVAQAYEILLSAREKYEELFAAAELIRIEKFIEAANNVPANVEDVDISWYGVLSAAGDAYFALTLQSQALPEVEEAFRRWDAAQTVFDRKGYKQIPMTDPILQFSGDYPPHIVLQYEDNMLKPLREFYEVSDNGALGQYVIIWLNVYVDGNYVAHTELPVSQIGHVVSNSVILNLLKGLSGTYSEIVSGANFSFSLNFEDREDRYIPSKYTKVSASKNSYVW